MFVNRRIVKDRTIAHAILDAYSVATNKERSPEVHLFLEVPPDQVDVNVHPTKAEVRFREQSLVHQTVRYALGDALGKGPAPELTLRTTDVIAGRPAQGTIPGALSGGFYPESMEHSGSTRTRGFSTGVQPWRFSTDGSTAERGTPVVNPRDEPRWNRQGRGP